MVTLEFIGGNAIVAKFEDLPRVVEIAMVRAMNRAIASGRTVMTSEIAGETGLRSRDVRDAIRMQEASQAKPEAMIAASLKRIPLIDFRATGPRPSRGRGRGVSYRIGGRAGRLSRAFIATMRSGHEGVFERRMKKRLQIDEKFGPSLGHIFAKHRQAGIDRALEVFQKNFQHELGFAQAQNAGTA